MFVSRSVPVESQCDDDCHDGDQDDEDTEQDGGDGPLGLLFGSRGGFGLGFRRGLDTGELEDKAEVLVSGRDREGVVLQDSSGLGRQDSGSGVSGLEGVGHLVGSGRDAAEGRERVAYGIDHLHSVDINGLDSCVGDDGDSVHIVIEQIIQLRSDI